MKVKMRYQNTYEQPITAELELHKNQKGYNICLNGKYYFPKADNPVVQDISKFEHRELWVVVTKDNFNYGNISFAAADYFVIPEPDTKSVRVEKEIPCNKIDDPEDPYFWDYEVIGRCKTVEGTDAFIDSLESIGCPAVIIKQALNEFYNLN